jgi:hypothetical protein
MSLWMLFVLFALIKLPLIGLMLWMPFRNDEADDRARSTHPTPPTPPRRMEAAIRCPPGPIDPHPRMPLPRTPRRDPHGSPAIPAPARVRTPVRAKGVKISR